MARKSRVLEGRAAPDARCDKGQGNETLVRRKESRESEDTHPWLSLLRLPTGWAGFSSRCLEENEHTCMRLQGEESTNQVHRVE